MRNRQGNTKIRSNIQSLANILAYHLSGRIEYYKLTNFNVGKRELVGQFKKYRSFSKELGNTLISVMGRYNCVAFGDKKHIIWRFIGALHARWHLRIKFHRILFSQLQADGR